MRIPFLPHRHAHQLAAATILAAAFLFGPGAAADDSGPMAPAPVLIAAPAIELQRLDGTPFSLAARKGKFTLINFWALWCAPCREEMPALARLRIRMAGQGLEVLAVNLGDKPEAVTRFLKQVDAGGLTILMDRKSSVGRDWHVQALPATFLVGPDGTITHAAVGARDWSAGAALRWFEKWVADAAR
jgi:thiol-disulfide isomerase/thioredoxin